MLREWMILIKKINKLNQLVYQRLKMKMIVKLKNYKEVLKEEYVRS